jgi:PAS domain S-box-containing protein
MNPAVFELNGPGNTPWAGEPHPDATLNPAFQAVLAELRGQCREDFSAYKPSTVWRGVGRRMAAHGMPSIEAYLSLLTQQGDEAFCLADSLKIGLTAFFRDEAVWQALREALVAKWREHAAARQRDAAAPGGPWRLWVCGCASGEEAYSWAMVLHEASEQVGVRADVRIFATDADPAAIDKARKGVYGRGIEAQLSPERLLRHFVKEPHSWRVKPELRAMITFAVHNALSDPPFGQLDFLSCRNLLMYLQLPAQQQLLARLHRCMRLGGWLMLGESESLGGAEAWFEPLQPQAAGLPLFRSRSAQPLLAAHPADIPSHLLLSGYYPGGSTPSRSSITEGPTMPMPPERSAPESAAPDSSVHPSGQPEPDALQAEPGPGPAGSSVSEENTGPAALNTTQAEIAQLRQSLAKARAELQTTREHAQQTREEVLSRMEELQATHEELTTSFEELRTLADALAQARRQAEDSLAHFGEVFDKAPVAYFTLNATGVIRQANALAASFLGVDAHLLPGHSLLQYVAESERLRLQGFFDEASRSGQTMACDLTLKAATTPERHLRAVANSSSGSGTCLVALYDQTPGQMSTHVEVPSASWVAQSMGWGVVLTDLKGRITWVNQAFCDLTGYSPQEAIGCVGAELLRTDKEPANASALATLEEAARSGRGLELELLSRKKDGSALWSHARIDPVIDENGHLLSYLGVHIDRTAHHFEKEELRQSMRLLDACQHMTQLGAWELDLGTETMTWTRGLYRLFDVSPTTFTPTLSSSLELMQASDRQRVRDAIQTAVQEGKPIDLVVDIPSTRGWAMQVRLVAAVRFEGSKAVKLYGAMQQVGENKTPGS